MGEKLLKVCIDNSLQPTLAISRWVCPVLVAAEVSTLSPKQVLEQGKPTRYSALHLLLYDANIVCTG